MTNARLEKAKEYAMSRTYPRFDSIFISNFVHREIERAYLEGSKETENLEYQIKNVQRALNKWVDKAKENKKEVEELEKEIAELKAEIENDKDLPTVAYMQGAEKQKKKDEKQLTKAKVILEELANMEYVINPPSNKVRSLMVKAEQFLKEIEK